MLAINIYTTKFYEHINPFLRGNMPSLSSAAKQGQDELNIKAKELLLAYLPLVLTNVKIPKLFPNILSGETKSFQKIFCRQELMLQRKDKYTK
jgi:hypothetical protein